MVSSPTTLKTNTPSLGVRLADRIRSDGPITFAEWMNAALYDEAEGYYCRTDRARWGRAGDYRTSPERSSLFAATFARYFARLYEQLDSSSEWTIVEAGAGDGRFAEGVLRTLKAFHPDVFIATSYVIDEVSPSSRSEITERLGDFSDRVTFGRIGDVVIERGIVFSNELLDAFPVHRVVMEAGELREVYVGLGSDSNFEFVNGSISTSRINEHLAKFEIKLQEGQKAEINLGIEDWLNRVSQTQRDGYLITTDYGAETGELYDNSLRQEGTLRGFKRHAFVENVLADPGEQDLTTTVHWSVVRRVGEELGFKAVDFATQDQFLIAAGLLEQLELESERCNSDSERVALRTSAREMILPSGMASHFQVLVQRKCV